MPISKFPVLYYRASGIPMSFLKKSVNVAIPVVLVIAIVLLIFLRQGDTEVEPQVFNPADLNPEYVDFGLRGIQSGHRIGNFQLINQLGDTVSYEQYKGKVFVTDFFFTRCPSICPVMTNNLGKIQEQFSDESRVKLLSISVTPTYDSVAVLKAYADKNDVISNKWNICTGDKGHIYELARKHFFAVGSEGDGLLQDFIHSPNFILVDSERRIRGIYDGTQDTEIQRLIKDMKIILN